MSHYLLLVKVGLCTSWIVSLDPHKDRGHIIPMWIKSSNMTHPPHNIPIIMVGPGTGCAIFRAFLQQRLVWAREGIRMYVFPSAYLISLQHWHQQYSFLDVGEAIQIISIRMSLRHIARR